MALDVAIPQMGCACQEQVFALVRKQVWYLRQPILTPLRISNVTYGWTCASGCNWVFASNTA